MENRYLFRGKRIDNGKWEIGSIIALPDGKFEIANKCENPPDSDPMWGKCVITHIVDPSTICQCIGLKDDEGTLIFENDVLSLKDEINKCEWRAVVKFGNPNAEYTWGWQLVPITECDANKDILLWVETGMGYMYCDIIGNRLDNPELLEV